MSDAKMPYIPPISVRDSTAGSETVMIIVGVLVGVVILFLQLQKWGRAIAQKRRKKFSTPREEVKPSATRFIGVNHAGAAGTLGLPVGQKLTVTFPDYEKTFTSTIINISEDGFVINLPPDNQRGGNPFLPNTDDAVQFFAIRDDKHLSFSTTVLQVFSGGLRACSLRHTAEMTTSNRRSNARVNGEGPALFTAIPSAAINNIPIPLSDLLGDVKGDIPAIVQDISVGGCALRTRSPIYFVPGDLVIVSACLPSTTHEFTAVAGLLAIKPQAKAEGGGSILNLEFLAPDEKTLELIGGHVASRLEDEVVE